SCTRPSRSPPTRQPRPRAPARLRVEPVVVHYATLEGPTATRRGGPLDQRGRPPLRPRPAGPEVGTSGLDARLHEALPGTGHVPQLLEPHGLEGDAHRAAVHTAEAAERMAHGVVVAPQEAAQPRQHGPLPGGRARALRPPV